jgi:hypothetical protein
VGPRTCLDAVVKRKIPSPSRGSNPRIPIVQPVGQRYTDGAHFGVTEKMTKHANEDLRFPPRIRTGYLLIPVFLKNRKLTVFFVSL